MDWLDLAQDRDLWRALVNMTTKLAASEEGLKLHGVRCQ
jgi:hypothetical protein